MLISTKGRYALRVMIDLAEHQNGDFIPLREIVERQGISQKYLEGIMSQLSRAGFVDGAHGKGGGYRLSAAPDQYRAGDILRLTEGSIAPVTCLECGARPCERADDCRTRPMWTKLDQLIGDFLDSVTIADLMESSHAEDSIL
ncbi:MAG: Rrf2 family transcriptional regulator [Clostridiaceae bacterium]|nr:Rrf2 family transcriptional regulator [Clostridiaceae bacterium]